jgi:LysR family transcriptional regulator, nod-box dependent transcriptional activator
MCDSYLAKLGIVDWRSVCFRSDATALIGSGRFTLVPQLVVGTTRIATVHRRLAQFYAKPLPLKILKPPVEIPPVVESMQWHVIRDGGPGLQWLRRILHSAFSEHPIR